MSAREPDVVRVEHPVRGAGARAAKRWALALAGLWVLPRRLAFAATRPWFGDDRAFLAASESIARIPGMRGVYCRQAFYARTLARCGRDVYFGWQSVFSMRAAHLIGPPRRDGVDESRHRAALSAGRDRRLDGMRRSGAHRLDRARCHAG